MTAAPVPGGDPLSSPDASARAVLQALADRGWTIGVAESLTGGLVSAALVSVPGASTSLRGGVVAYATDLKARILGVEEGLLEASGPVHPEVARQMAEGVRRVLGADVGVSTTGVAGPAPQRGIPVGTVFVAVATPDGTTVSALELDGTREEIRAETVRRALAACLGGL